MANYDVVTGPKRVFISSGETYENKVHDIRNGMVQVFAKGTNWTIRNVGVRGTIPRYWDKSMFAVADTGGRQSLMEHIYMGEGHPNSTGSENERTNMVWVDPDHSGHLTVRHVNFSSERNLGIYGSAPGWVSSGGRGTLHYDSCYAHNNHHTAYRISSNNDRITNCVAHADSGEYSNRAIWIWESPDRDTGFEVDGCEIDMNNSGFSFDFRPSGGGGPDGTISNTSYTGKYDSSGAGNITQTNTDSTPNIYIPSGVPHTWHEAATGSAPTPTAPTATARARARPAAIGFAEPPTAEYETITAQGQTITLSDGQTFENKLIDLSTGESIRISARNTTNVTIRNIGFTGYYEGEGFQIELSDTGGGTTRVENIYMADGASKSGTSFVHGPGAFYVGKEHTGHIAFRYINVQGYPGNGFYASSGTGTISFENCFAKNNGIASFRVRTTGDTIDNCVAYNDNTSYGWYDVENDYVEENGRPVWAWEPGAATIRNSDFDSGPYPYTMQTRAGATINFESGSWDGGPTTGDGTVNVGAGVTQPADLTMPDGVPTTATDAAAGRPTSDPEPLPDPEPEPAPEPYDVWEADGSWYMMSDGETLSNVIIDCRNGKWKGIHARHITNWTIRNVGFLGTHRVDRHAIVASDNAGGTSTIEDVYLGDGCVRPSTYRSHGQCGIFVGPEHSGHIDIRNCNIQDWPNNGIYASSPGYTGQGGTTHIDNCYAANNYVSNFRQASDGDRLTNSVSFNSPGGRYAGRPYWGWYPGLMTVDNCEFDGGEYASGDDIWLGRHDNHTEFRIQNSSFTGINTRGSVNVIDGGGNDTNPDLSMPSGIPTSATEAASNNPPQSPEPAPEEPTPPGEDADYEVIVANDQTIHVDDNEVFQNKLIDCTNGKGCRISAADSEGWVIANIGFLGQPDELASFSMLHVGVPTTDGTGHVENVFLPGVTTDTSTGITVDPTHAGSMTITRVRAEQFGWGGINASRHGADDGAGGYVHVDDCYFKNNNWGNVVLSGADDLTNTTILETTKAAPKHGYGLTAYPNGPITVDNCIFAMNGKNYSIVAGASKQPSNVTVTNSSYDIQFNGGLLERSGSTITLGEGNDTDPFADPASYQNTPDSAEVAAGGDPVIEPDPPTGPPTKPENLEFPGAIGYLSTEFTQSIIPVPIYDPAHVDWPAAKIQLSDPDINANDIGALAIAPRHNAAFPSMSFETAAGVYAPTHLGAPRLVSEDGGTDPAKEPGEVDGSLLVDNFDTNISGAWLNDADWETSAKHSFRGARAARRQEFGLALTAGPEEFPEWLRKGGPYARMAVRSNTPFDPAQTQLEFARSRVPHETGRYGVQVDWVDNVVRINSIAVGGAVTTLAERTIPTPGIATNEWYDLIVQWAGDDTIRVWFYARDGTLLTTFEATGDGKTGDYWAINTTRPTNMYVDEVSFYEAHPYTGIASGATLGGGTYTPETADTVDNFDYVTPDTLDTFYGGDTDKMEVVATPALSEGGSLRLRTEEHGGAEIVSAVGDMLEDYPREGNNVRWYFRSNKSSTTAEDVIRHRFRFGMTGTSDYFDATLNIRDRAYSLGEKRADIERVAFADPNATAHIPSNRWIRGELEWRENRIRLRYVDNRTEEVLAPWTEGSPSFHDPSDAEGADLGFGVVHTALAANDELWTDSIELAPTEDS